MKRIITLFITMVFSLSGFAQERQITGKVTDADGALLPGVTIQLIGTNTGTITDVNGLYKISAAQGTLRFSYIGFVTQEIVITTQTTIDIILEEETSMLNEVVVIGYGTQKKKDITTAVSVVDDKEIKERPIVSAAQALQGKAAGVQVTQPSGKPGVGLSVRVRGSTSVIAGNEPLYVIDGVPTTNTEGLNPSDIASMTVLKDASSSAIYGARAANGVVLITTKHGGDEAGTVISFDSYVGFSRLRKPIEVLNTKDYIELMDEIPGISTESIVPYFGVWSDSVFGTGVNQSYQFSYGGGNEKSKYFFSAGYLSDAGMVEPARFDRYTVRFNLDNQLTPWLKMGTNLNISRLRKEDTPDNLSSGRGGVIMSTLNTPPFLTIWDQDSIGWYCRNPFQNSWENPVAYMYGADQQSIDNGLFGNVYADIKLMPDLIFTTRFGIDYITHQWDYFLDPVQTSWGRTNHGLAQSDKSNNSTWLWENTFNYSKKIGDHNITAMAGGSAQKNSYNQTYLQGTGFRPGSNTQTINAANDVSGSTYRSEWSILSFFARATYDFKSRYYLTATVREDGSSKLNHHWGFMPSFSAGWRISGEKFMANATLIDDLKIRGGWGKNGNQEGIGNYNTWGLVSFSPNADADYPSEYPISYGNPDLKWETTAQTNVGIDLSMFNFRLGFTFDAYYKKTSDVLLPVPLSNTLPVTMIQTNAGTIENKGIEFSINSVNINKKLIWTTNLNMSFNRNEVLSLSEYSKVYYFGYTYSNNSYVSMVKVGEPIGVFYGWISEGVDPATGNLIYKDFNENGIFDTGDRTVIGDPHPDFIFGFTNTFTYWKFDLNIFFQGSVGNDIYNATRIDLEGMFDSKNQSVEVLDRWTPENTETDIPKAANMDNVRSSTRFVEDGSYVRLKQVTLSYKILDNNPKVKAIKQFSVYVTGNNLLTFTKYSGFDPEVNAYGNNATEIGIDYGTYPQSLGVIVGLNVQF
jgi:TonB-dependent starch-binding outer membrane protein SusC